MNIIYTATCLLITLFNPLHGHHDKLRPTTTVQTGAIDIDAIKLNQPIIKWLGKADANFAEFTLGKDTLAYLYEVSKKSPEKRLYTLSGTNLKTTNVTFYTSPGNVHLLKGISVYIGADDTQINLSQFVNQIVEKYKAFGGAVKNPDPKYYAAGVKYYAWRVNNRIITMAYYPNTAETAKNTLFFSIIDPSFILKSYPLYIRGTGIMGYLKHS